jgi:hypothetical protein
MVLSSSPSVVYLWLTNLITVTHDSTNPYLVDLCTFHIFLLACPLVILKEFQVSEYQALDSLRNALRSERETREAMHGTASS